MWMSLAPAFAALLSVAFTSRTMGGSFTSLASWAGSTISHPSSREVSISPSAVTSVSRSKDIAEASLSSGWTALRAFRMALSEDTTTATHLLVRNSTSCTMTSS